MVNAGFVQNLPASTAHQGVSYRTAELTQGVACWSGQKERHSCDRPLKNQCNDASMDQIRIVPDRAAADRLAVEQLAGHAAESGQVVAWATLAGTNRVARLKRIWGKGGQLTLRFGGFCGG